MADPTVAAAAADRSAADRRAAKFRQAAFVYLHVGLLYEVVVWVLAGQGAMPADRGPIWLWLAFGAVIVGAVFAGLWHWRSVWLARGIWALHLLRLPALVDNAFFPDAASRVPASLWGAAIVVVLVNLAFLARAGWDL